MKRYQTMLMVALCCVAFMMLAQPSHAIGYVHYNCAGAESPVVQEAIHDSHEENQDCANITDSEDGDGEAVGHEQECSAGYGAYQWTSLDCNFGSAAGCDASSLIYCAGQYITAHVHCPPSQGGPNAGKLPQASSNRFGAACSYHDFSGNIVGKTCTCTVNSGCS